MILLLLSMGTFWTAVRSGGWEEIRTVQALLLVTTGMCLGAALSLLVRFGRARKDEEAAR
jgi:hypothetical protein